MSNELPDLVFIEANRPMRAEHSQQLQVWSDALYNSTGVRMVFLPPELRLARRPEDLQLFEDIDSFLAQRDIEDEATGDEIELAEVRVLRRRIKQARERFHKP